MEGLPNEMIAEIAQNLTVKDLAACCAVSPVWREMFGCDEVWKPRCDKDAEEPLRTSPCRVEPKFESPEAENTTLSPIGYWRIAFMRETHLRKNWFYGKYTENNIEIAEKCHLASFLLNDFLVTCWEGTLQLIDLRCSPPVRVAQLDVNCFRASKVIDHTFDVEELYACKASDNMFLIKKVCGIDLIKVDLEAYVFSVQHTLHIFDGEVTSSNMFVVGNIAFVESRVQKKFYIYDIEKNISLKVEAYREIIGPTSAIRYSLSENCSDIAICFENPGPQYSLNVYSLNELRFFPFKYSNLKIVDFAIVDKFIALNYPEPDDCFISFRMSLQVYNYLTSQLVFEFPAGYSIVALSNSFFIQDDSMSMFQSLTPTSGNNMIVRLYTVNNESSIDFFPGSIIPNCFKLIDDKLIIDNTECTSNAFKVNLKSSTVTFHRSSGDVITVDRACSKLVKLTFKGNKTALTVVNFW